MSTLKRKLKTEETFQISLRWIITEKKILEAKYQIRSSEVLISGLPEVKYYIKLQPKRTAKDAEKRTSVYFGLIMPKNLKISINANVTCKIANISKSWSHVYEEAVSFGSQICSFADLIDPSKKFIVDKKLIIKIYATLNYKKLDDLAIVPAAKVPHLDNNVFGNRLWNDDDLKNVKIIIDNKYEIKAHKCALKGCSLKFAKIFEKNSEARETKIFIENKNFDTVKEAIMHCYGIQNSAILSAEEATNLLIFAAEYEMEDLKQNMEELCIENLSVSNATLFANASMIAGSDKLKNICLEFLSKCMETHTSIKNFDILDAEIKEILLRQSFETIIE